MEDCIFCKIIRGEIPATKVYEDEDTLAFLDINPAAKGHTLVTSKDHHETINDTPNDLLFRLIASVKKVAIALESLNGGANIIQNNKKEAGQLVPHIHFHVIPREVGDNINIGVWKAGKYREGEMEETASKIRRLLK